MTPAVAFLAPVRTLIPAVAAPETTPLTAFLDPTITAVDADPAALTTLPATLTGTDTILAAITPGPAISIIGL